MLFGGNPLGINRFIYNSIKICWIKLLFSVRQEASSNNSLPNKTTIDGYLYTVDCIYRVCEIQIYIAQSFTLRITIEIKKSVISWIKSQKTPFPGELL